MERVGRQLGAPGKPWVAWTALLIFVCSATALIYIAKVMTVTGNPASRLATIEALVDHDTWRINQSIYRYTTVDKVRIGFDFYSSKPPIYAAVGSVVYRVLRAASDSTFAQTPRRFEWWLRLVLQVLPFIFGLILAGRFLGKRLNSPLVWLIFYVAWAAGTFVFGYSATINNHAPAAILVLFSLVAAVRLLENGGGPIWLWFATGFFACVAVTLDFGAAPWAIGVTVALLWRTKSPSLGFLLLGALGPALLHLYLTHQITGSYLPFYGRGEFYDYPGSYWLNRRDFDALSEPGWVYIFHSTFGHHGLFSMTPVYLLAVPAVLRLRQFPAARVGDRTLVALSVAVIAMTFTVYWTWAPTNYGGMAMGMRWFIVLAPIFWYLAARYADIHAQKPWFVGLLIILVLVGVVNAVLALPAPWGVSPWNALLREFGMGSVPPFNRWLPM